MFPHYSYRKQNRTLLSMLLGMYVSMSLLKKYDKGSCDKAVQYIECLSGMAVNGEGSSFPSLQS